jgi:uncharacterized protein with von Willebrand factor type A (vWA) domain
MFLPFFDQLRAHKVPVSLREFLSFLEAMKAGMATYDMEHFYLLGRSILVKDERNLDKYDRAFAASFEGLEHISPQDMLNQVDIPEEWLRKLAEKTLSEADKAEIEALGGFDKLMETLRKRLEEQKGRHQGGSKWVGTAGTSPFGAYGYNPEGVRIGQAASRHQRAVKVWDKRSFKNLDGDVELGTRNIKVALKRLRKWARDGAQEELDLDATIRKTAENGYIDVQTRPERRNAVKVLLFLDIGGSMDPHVKMVEELFSAAGQNSSISKAIISTTAFMKGSGATMPDVGTHKFQQKTSFVPMEQITNAFLLGTPRCLPMKLLMQAEQMSIGTPYQVKRGCAVRRTTGPILFGSTPFQKNTGPTRNPLE